jgi:hypothetical protein
MVITQFSELTGRKKYNEITEEERTKCNRHMGQIKLLFSEILFLSNFYKDEELHVVYVGAADGRHIGLLAKLFPKMTFDLYDSEKFMVKKSQQITIYNRYFDDDDAERYAKDHNKILFISDIRNLDIEIVKRKDPTLAFDDLIDEDMERQSNWIKIIKPIAASLKFHLPYVRPTYEYLTGPIYLQPFSPISTENRLYVTDYNKTKIYDAKENDEKMTYFNTVTRCEENKDKKWKKTMKKYNLKNIWDTSYSLDILEFYLKKTNHVRDKDTVCEMFTKIIEYMRQFGRAKYDNLFIHNTV